MPLTACSCASQEPTSRSMMVAQHRATRPLQASASGAKASRTAAPTPSALPSSSSSSSKGSTSPGPSRRFVACTTSWPSTHAPSASRSQASSTSSSEVGDQGSAGGGGLPSTTRPRSRRARRQAWRERWRKRRPRGWRKTRSLRHMTPRTSRACRVTTNSRDRWLGQAASASPLSPPNKIHSSASFPSATSRRFSVNGAARAASRRPVSSVTRSWK
mmetsp:Transcript_9788/g.27707  ORF Transcript_9788/g.27707 Transcript_9788/m.27707 type:complete len:216 (+) Transcript_9788:571-1218(+)